MTFYSTELHSYGINGFQGPSRRAFGAARELKKLKNETKMRTKARKL
jgi:hypothetical protein